MIFVLDYYYFIELIAGLRILFRLGQKGVYTPWDKQANDVAVRFIIKVIV